MSDRQTKRDIVRLFKERGIRANRLLGQNLLVNHNVLDYVCREAKLSDGDVVLEIGAGTGLLTQHIAASGAQVVAVEIDANLFGLLTDYVGDRPNVRCLHCDVHGTRRRVNDVVLAALEQAMAAGGPLKVVSNLPYCISSDLLVSLVELPWMAERMVLTVQKEFAERLVAKAGSRDYGPLTAILNAHGDTQRLRDLQPSVFWPVPNVGSTVVRFRPCAERFERVADYARFKAVVSALFSHRRKTALAALRTMTRPRVPKEALSAALDAAGVPEDARADKLCVDEIIELANRTP